MWFYHAVRIDGKILLDTGVNRGLGDSKVSTVNPKQGQGTISDINGNVVTIDPYIDNCFKEGQFLTQATPKPILITPQTDDITTIAGDVLTLSGSKDLLEFAPGDPVSMVNVDGSAATYDAETSAIESVGVTDYSTGGTIVGNPHPAGGNTVGVLFNGEVSKNFGTTYGIASPNGTAALTVTFGSEIVVNAGDAVKAAIFTNDVGQPNYVDIVFEDDSTQRITSASAPLGSASGTVEVLSTILRMVARISKVSALWDQVVESFMSMVSMSTTL